MTRRPMRRPVSGVCRYCRCTDENACEGGCSWVDDEHTICSECEHLATTIVKVTFSRTELDAIRRAARRAGLTSAQFVLGAARRATGLVDPRRPFSTSGGRPHKGRR